MAVQDTERHMMCVQLVLSGTISPRSSTWAGSFRSEIGSDADRKIWVSTAMVGSPKTRQHNIAVFATDAGKRLERVAIPRHLARPPPPPPQPTMIRDQGRQIIAQSRLRLVRVKPDFLSLRRTVPQPSSPPYFAECRRSERAVSPCWKRCRWPCEDKNTATKNVYGFL